MTDKSRPKSEKLSRVITGLCLAAALVALWAIQGWPLRIALWLMLLLGMWEMYAAFEHKGAHPVKWVGMAYALAVVPAYLLLGTGALPPVLGLFCMLGLGAIVLRGKADFESAVATVFPLMYPGYLTTLLIPLVDMQPKVYAHTAFALVFLVSLINDLAAYAIGMRYGKRKLCPGLSPKKSVEGAVAGVIASMLMAMIAPPAVYLVTRQPLAQMPPMWQFALLGLVGGVASPIGDLTASLVKRHCGIKDYGNIFPGHGGMMDRMDSVIFAGAVIYCYFALALGAV